MSEDVRYPIYRVTAEWPIDGDQGERYARSDGLPEGRVWNGTSFERMYREDPGAGEVERWAREEWWPAMERKGDNPGEPKIEVSPEPRFESWCPAWFEHWTFDTGQSDADALASFERYVRRHERSQDWPPGERPEGAVCLMGAEDRWRWCGSGDDGQPESRTPPPCRCKHCREQGKIRVGH